MIDVKELLQYENAFAAEGYKMIAGIDEVGRGPLAGPVVCACVIMPLDELIPGVYDSKKVSVKNRERLYDVILKKAIAYNIASVSPTVIDDVNILNATKLCMQTALAGMAVKPDMLLIDALNLQTECAQYSIIKGDAKSYNIAAGSIIAKVYRDRLMERYACEYPEYGFDKHKGYGTAQHIAALKTYGKSPIHRNTFIRNFI